MKYVSATIVAIITFAVLFLLCAIICGNVLPEKINHMKIKFYLGSFYLFANPTLLISAPLAIAAAIHTFRNTVRHYTVDCPKPPEPPDTL